MIEITIVAGLGCWAIRFVLVKLGLQPSFIFNNKSLLFLDLDGGALDLSFWSWALGPASFLIKDHDCFWTWMLEHWTCLLKVGLRPSFISNGKSFSCRDLDIGALDLALWSWALDPTSLSIRNYDRFWGWMLEHWTCPFENGSAAQPHFQ